MTAASSKTLPIHSGCVMAELGHRRGPCDYKVASLPESLCSLEKSVHRTMVWGLEDGGGMAREAAFAAARMQQWDLACIAALWVVLYRPDVRGTSLVDFMRLVDHGVVTTSANADGTRWHVDATVLSPSIHWERDDQMGIKHLQVYGPSGFVRYDGLPDTVVISDEGLLMDEVDERECVSNIARLEQLETQAEDLRDELHRASRYADDLLRALELILGRYQDGPCEYGLAEHREEAEAILAACEPDVKALRQRYGW
jgi:hypothetical protein